MAWHRTSGLNHLVPLTGRVDSWVTTRNGDDEHKHLDFSDFLVAKV